MPGKIKVDGPPSVDGAPPRLGDAERREARRLLRAAHVGNAVYLGTDQPTAAGTREQVQSLTAQVDAISRLVAG